MAIVQALVDVGRVIVVLLVAAQGTQFTDMVIQFLGENNFIISCRDTFITEFLPRSLVDNGATRIWNYSARAQCPASVGSSWLIVLLDSRLRPRSPLSCPHSLSGSVAICFWKFNHISLSCLRRIFSFYSLFSHQMLNAIVIILLHNSQHFQ